MRKYLLIFVVIISLFSGYYLLSDRQKQKDPDLWAYRTEHGYPVEIHSSKIISTNLTSPDGAYRVTMSPNPLPPFKQTQVIFSVYDTTLEKGVTEVAFSVRKEKVDNTRTIGCDCIVTFKGWVNNTIFAVKTINEEGKEFEESIDILYQIQLNDEAEQVEL